MLTQNTALKRTLIMWIPPLLVVLLSGVLQLLDGVEPLRYQRDMIEAGQIWRLFTGHLVHLGWSHWLLNAAGLLLVWALMEPPFRTFHAIFDLAVCCLLVGLGLFYFSSNVVWYVGLSGALHGLLIVYVLRQLQKQPVFSLLLLGLLLGKLLWEQFFGPLPGSERSAGGPVLVIAHAYGAVAGVIIVLCSKGFKYWRKKADSPWV